MLSIGKRFLVRGLAVAGVSLAACSQGTTAFAEGDLAAYWEDKTIRFIVSQGPGGGYDTAARILGQHMGRHIPGEPDIIVENMPGGSHRVATNYVYLAEPDGLTLQMLNWNVPGYQFAGEGPEEGVRFDVAEMGWIGAQGTELQVLVMHERTGVTPETIDMLSTQSWKLANEGSGGGPHRIQAILELGLGWQFEPIFGYEGGDRDLALIRGEVDGIITTWDALRRERREELASGAWVPVLTLGGENPEDEPFLEGVHEADDLFAARSDADRAILGIEMAKYAWARALVAPPGMEPELLTALRRAYDATVADPEYLAEAERTGMSVDPVAGEMLQAMIAEYMTRPQEPMNRIMELVEAESE